MTEDHHHHHQQQQQHPPPKPLKHDPISKPMALNPISFSNGGSGGASLKKHRHLPHQHQNNNNNNNNNLYRECLKNHAASLGGHALDGCGEFMPSPTFNPSVPTSLTCAACGCHRNFHRRLLPSPPHSPRRHHYLHHHYRDKPPDDSDDGDQAEAAAAAAGEEDDDEDDDDDDHSSSPPPPLPPSATPYYNSAPHMLMALRAGASGGRPADPHRPLPTAAPESSTLLPRKRFRTRFSPEQKERMHQLSERLGWRLQKKDDAVVDQCCREISIGKGVFKVWMHNNKHNFHKGHRASPAPAPGGGPNTTATGGVNGTVSDMNRDAGHRGNSNHALNGSSPPSSSS